MDFAIASTPFVLLSFFIGFLNADGDPETIYLSIIHTHLRFFCIFECIIVDNGIVFNSPQATRVNMSKIRENLVNMVLSDIGADVLYDDRCEFDAIFRRIRVG